MAAPEKLPGALPKFIQISELIIRDIDAGRLIDGEKLPPERDMARTFGTSIGTLRKALAELQKKGLLHRVQGSGNYVQRPVSAQGVYAMFRLELPEGGGLPTALVLDVETLEKPGELPDFGTSRFATRIRRMRHLNDKAVAAEEIWLDAGAGTLRREELSESLYQTYLRRLHFWISRAEDRVGIGALPDWTPAAVGPPGAVCGFIERFGWAEASVPLEFSRTWFDPARAVYVQRLK